MLQNIGAGKTDCHQLYLYEYNARIRTRESCAHDGDFGLRPHLPRSGPTIVLGNAVRDVWISCEDRSNRSNAYAGGHRNVILWSQHVTHRVREKRNMISRVPDYAVSATRGRSALTSVSTCNINNKYY